MYTLKSTKVLPNMSVEVTCHDNKVIVIHYCSNLPKGFVKLFHLFICQQRLWNIDRHRRRCCLLR